MEFETFSITPGDLQDEVVDVTPISQENRAIITYRTKGVEIYDLKDRNCIKSWTQNPATIAAAAAAAAAAATTTTTKRKRSTAATTGQITFCTRSLLQPRSKRLCSVVNGTSLLSWSFSLPSFGDDVLLSLAQQQKRQTASSRRGKKSATDNEISTTSIGSALFAARALPTVKKSPVHCLLSTTTTNSSTGTDSDGDCIMGGDGDLYAVFENGHVLRVTGSSGTDEMTTTEIFAPTPASGRSSISTAVSALWAQMVLDERYILVLLVPRSTAASAPKPSLVVIDTAKEDAAVRIPLGGDMVGTKDRIAGCDYDEDTKSLCVAWTSGKWEVLRVNPENGTAVNVAAGSVEALISVTGVAWASKDVVLLAGTAKCELAAGDRKFGEGDAMVIAVETVYTTLQAVTKTNSPVTHIVRLDKPSLSNSNGNK